MNPGQTFLHPLEIWHQEEKKIKFYIDKWSQ